MSALGIVDDLAALETETEIHETFRVDGKTIKALDAVSALAAVRAYGSALTLEFQIGDLPIFTLSEPFDAGAFKTFQSEADGTFTLVVHLKKDVLLEPLGVVQPEVRPFLFLFPRALQRVLQEGLESIERRFWPDGDSRVLIILADSQATFVGPRLSVIGFDQLSRAEGLFTETSWTEARLALVRDARDRLVSWDRTWISTLTPIHFGGTGTTSIASLDIVLRSLLVRLVILYTCDRARTHAGGANIIRAEYRGGSHVASVVLDEAAPPVSVDATEADLATNLFDWCYAAADSSLIPHWAADRLSFVQTRLAQLLEPRNEAARIRTFPSVLPPLLEGLEWRWKAFLENKIDQYVDQVNDLQSAVTETTSSYAGQASSMVDDLVKNVLAAVAVLVGTFVAAAFDDPFNRDLFRVSMLVYVSYLVLFPGLLGIVSNWRRFFGMAADFAARRTSFEKVLEPAEVESIVRLRIASARREYFAWLTVVSIIYIGVAGAGLMAASEIPDVVRQHEDSGTKTGDDSPEVKPTGRCLHSGNEALGRC